MVASFRRGRNKRVCAALPNVTTKVTSPDEGSVDDLYDINDSFTASLGSVPGLIYGIMHSTPMGAIRESLRSEVGPQQHRADVQNFLAVGAEMLLNFLIFPTNEVQEVSSYYENSFMLPGALGYGLAMPESNSDALIAPTDMPLLIELSRVGRTDTYEIIANAYDGVAIRETARARGLRTVA
jgi:hypothetical protein